MIGIISIFMLVELIVGIIANSLTLQLDSFHMITDLIAVCIGWYATLNSSKQDKNNSYGLKRLEIIGAFFNSVFLLGVCFNLAIETIHKFINIKEGSEIIEKNIDTVMIVGGLGLFVNILMFLLLHLNIEHNHHHDHHHHDTNLKAVALHVLGDMLGSIAVIFSGLIIKYVNYTWKFYVDPICSILIIFIILFNLKPVILRCYNILIQNIPEDIDIQKITNEILKIKGIKSIHDFHIWQLDDNIYIATLHYVIDTYESRSNNLNSNIKKILHKYNIHSSTLQIEFDYSLNCNEIVCREDCNNYKCCKNDNIETDNLLTVNV